MTPVAPGKMSATSVPTDHVPRRSTAIVSRVTRTAVTDASVAAVLATGAAGALFASGCVTPAARRTRPRRRFLELGSMEAQAITGSLKYNSPGQDSAP